jgi:hypothetical protein
VDGSSLQPHLQEIGFPVGNSTGDDMMAGTPRQEGGLEMQEPGHYDRAWGGSSKTTPHAKTLPDDL